MLAFRCVVMDSLLKDKEWSRKLEKAKTYNEVEKVVVDFCKVKGFKVVSTKETG